MVMGKVSNMALPWSRPGARKPRNNYVGLLIQEASSAGKSCVVRWPEKESFQRCCDT